MHPGSPAEPVLVAWGITADGKPVLLPIQPGSSESIDAWRGFPQGIAGRGLRQPTWLSPTAVPALSARTSSGSFHDRPARVFDSPGQELPQPQRHRIRHANFIERTSGETRWPVKVICRLPGERGCLSLICVLDRSSPGMARRRDDPPHRPSTSSSCAANSSALHRLQPPNKPTPKRSSRPSPRPP